MWPTCIYFIVIENNKFHFCIFTFLFNKKWQFYKFLIFLHFYIDSIFKKFPELQEADLTLEDIFDISARKFKDHVVYSRILHEQDKIETSFKVMDLGDPMINKNEEEYLDKVIDDEFPELNSDMFIQFYNSDQLGGMIRNLDIWLKDIFSQFKSYKNWH